MGPNHRPPDREKGLVLFRGAGYAGGVLVRTGRKVLRTDSSNGRACRTEAASLVYPRPDVRSGWPAQKNYTLVLRSLCRVHVTLTCRCRPPIGGEAHRCIAVVCTLHMAIKLWPPELVPFDGIACRLLVYRVFVFILIFIFICIFMFVATSLLPLVANRQLTAEANPLVVHCWPPYLSFETNPPVPSFARSGCRSRRDYVNPCGDPSGTCNLGRARDTHQSPSTGTSDTILLLLLLLTN
jgi:hypothetical protein